MPQCCRRGEFESVGHLANQVANDPGIGHENRFARIDHFFAHEGNGREKDEQVDQALSHARSNAC